MFLPPHREVSRPSNVYDLTHEFSFWIRSQDEKNSFLSCKCNDRKTSSILGKFRRAHFWRLGSKAISNGSLISVVRFPKYFGNLSGNVGKNVLLQVCTASLENLSGNLLAILFSTLQYYEVKRKIVEIFLERNGEEIGESVENWKCLGICRIHGFKFSSLRETIKVTGYR